MKEGKEIHGASLWAESISRNLPGLAGHDSTNLIFMKSCCPVIQNKWTGIKRREALELKILFYSIIITYKSQGNSLWVDLKA
jgi:hypothetical protein